MKILFICSANMERSPTAEIVIRETYLDMETKSAGTSIDARQRVNSELVQWADAILCMESYHKSCINFRFPEFIEGKEVSVLNIPDNYGYMSAQLAALVKERFRNWLDDFRSKEK